MCRVGQSPMAVLCLFLCGSALAAGAAVEEEVAREQLRRQVMHEFRLRDANPTADWRNWSDASGRYLAASGGSVSNLASDPARRDPPSPIAIAAILGPAIIAVLVGAGAILLVAQKPELFDRSRRRPRTLRAESARPDLRSQPPQPAGSSQGGPHRKLNLARTRVRVAEWIGSVRSLLRA